MIDNLSANARQGDTTSIPDLGRYHMPRSKKAREPQLLSLCAPEPALLNKRSHLKEKLTDLTRESPCSHEDPAQPKINKQIKKKMEETTVMKNEAGKVQIEVEIYMLCFEGSYLGRKEKGK